MLVSPVVSPAAFSNDHDRQISVVVQQRNGRERGKHIRHLLCGASSNPEVGKDRPPYSQVADLLGNFAVWLEAS